MIMNGHCSSGLLLRNSMPRSNRVISKWRRSERRRLRTCVECGRPFPSTDPSNRTCPQCLKREAEARARPFSLDSERRGFLSVFLESFGEEVDKFRMTERGRDDDRAARQRMIRKRREKMEKKLQREKEAAERKKKTKKPRRRKKRNG
jgi:hypothetical protein